MSPICHLRLVNVDHIYHDIMKEGLLRGNILSRFPSFKFAEEPRGHGGGGNNLEECHISVKPLKNWLSSPVYMVMFAPISKPSALG